MTTTHPASDGAEKRPVSQTKPLSLLSVVIPARDEAGCIAATVEHLHLELRLHGIPEAISSAVCSPFNIQLIGNAMPATAAPSIAA